jgi:hypothetical protein
MTIAGTWYNELGSVMNLNVNGSVLSGSYQTAVGNAQGIYALTGGLDSLPFSGEQAAGFVVAWINQYGTSNSVTTWSGQYQVISGVEQIHTLWLLTGETYPQDNWASTLIHNDLFMRTQPSKEQIAEILLRGPAPHPIPGPSVPNGPDKPKKK